MTSSGTPAPVDVILPCLNEAGALPWVLRRMPDGYRAIVVDNGSSDDSVAVALDHGPVDRRFGYPLEMVLSAAEKRWRIEEVDVDYRPRIGDSKVTGTLRGTLRAVKDMRQVMAA